ncbi:MAG: AEC family transporter [Alphaproteobacteria bacterium]|nr:AEC family transporter [Alphaproteobacteria bacterium]MBU0796362.1 AEC family transporter [Alphaproteobacteria bacterium]MBU0888605.1 AEC family transporter [Alphaproteobacteria bacterium]MBU1813661.1 AEC family transporter [Alphaproteobacteria bacterium]MBU2090589.1 AEC family transporter [Alphaproteobacteria bacterium]
MQAVFNVALPVFGIMLAGYLAGRAGLLGDTASQALNSFVYYFAMPPLLFLSIAQVPLGDIFNWPFLAAYTGGVLAVFVIAVVAGLIFFPGRPALHSMQGMAATFANTGYMGVPLFIAAFGDQMLLPAFITTLYNGALYIGVMIILIELDMKAGSKPLHIMRDVGIAIARNPLVMAAVVGLIFSAFAIPVPIPLLNFSKILGAAAGPAALFSMGLFLYGKPLKGGRAEVGLMTFLKLIVMPLVTWWLAVPVMGMDPFWAASAVIMAALPTGGLAFVLSLRYGIYTQRMSATILVSTVLSVFTVSAILVYFGIE